MTGAGAEGTETGGWQSRKRGLSPAVGQAAESPHKVSSSSYLPRVLISARWDVRSGVHRSLS